MDIIVVFGDVPSHVCRYLCDAMMRKGLRPKIVRIDPEVTYKELGDFTAAANDRVQNDHDVKTIPFDTYSVLMDQAMQTLQGQVLAHDLGSPELRACVRGVIYPDRGPDYAELWDWATDQFPDNIAVYTVQKSEGGGSLWLSGCGFGDSLPPA